MFKKKYKLHDISSSSGKPYIELKSCITSLLLLNMCNKNIIKHNNIAVNIIPKPFDEGFYNTKHVQ